MAGSFFNPPYGNNSVGVATVAFSFEANGASQPDATKILGGKVTSISRVTTGIYTVTLSEDCLGVFYAAAVVEDVSTPDGARASIRFSASSGQLQSPLSFTVNTFSTGTTLDNLVAGRRVFVKLLLKKSAGA
jgi:hypothetical protein